MQKFSSKKDWWVLAFLVCLSGLLVQLLFTMQAKGNISAYPVHSATYIITIFIIWWPVFNTRYAVEHEQLIIRCMFLKWIIPLNQIQCVSKTTNSIASPALSLDRIKIEYTKNGENKFILLSPRDTTAFCDAINKKIMT